VDVAAPAELIRRHCPEQTVIISTGDSTGAARLSAIPGVDSATSHEGKVTVTGRGDELVAHVIRCIAEYRINVTDFRTERATLEDVFIRLTGHSIRN
jgi:ABC-2 type transport system ATP-binding protein